MYMIYCDSSIEPFNPGGILAWAYIAKLRGTVIHQDVQISGWGEGTTNNQGEFQAVVGAMLWLISLPPKERLPAIVHSDSQLIVNQCTGSWQCRDEKLIPLLDLVKRAKSRYKKSILFKWIPRDRNEEADALSRTLYTKEAIELIKNREMDIIFGDDDVPW
jgi:ribonuclease HI